MRKVLVVTILAVAMAATAQTAQPTEQDTQVALQYLLDRAAETPRPYGEDNQMRAANTVLLIAIAQAFAPPPEPEPEPEPVIAEELVHGPTPEPDPEPEAVEEGGDE